MFIDHLFCVTITSESQSRAVGVFTELYAHPALLSGITFTKPRMGMLGNLGRFKYIWTAGYTSRNKKAASFRAFLFPINQTCNSFSLMSKKISFNQNLTARSLIFVPFSQQVSCTELVVINKLSDKYSLSSPAVTVYDVTSSQPSIQTCYWESAPFSMSKLSNELILFWAHAVFRQLHQAGNSPQ